ncbi:hypothetical protein SMICM17S_09809 [Streptomyces microflavus]
MDAHGGGDPGEHGRGVEPAVLQAAFELVGPAAAAQDGGAALHGVVDELLQVGAPLLAGKRSDVGGLLQRVAHGEGAHPGGEVLGERVVHVGVDDEPLGGDAGLAVVLDAGGDGGGRGLLDVGRWQHDVRVAAAELQHGLLDLVTGGGGDGAARRFAAGEGGRRDPGIAQDGLDGARADQQRTETPRRESGAVEQILQVERGLRHVRRVLEEAYVARHQRGGGEAHHLPEREVPRHHGEDDTERAVADQGPGGTGVRHVGGVRVLVGEQALRVGRVPAHRLGALGRLGTGRGDRLAHFEGHRAGDGVAVRVQQVGGPVQPDGTLLERGGAVLLEGGVGGGDPALGLLLAQGVVGPDQFAVRGVDRRDGHGSGLLASVLRRCRAAWSGATRPLSHVPGRRGSCVPDGARSASAGCAGLRGSTRAPRAGRGGTRARRAAGGTAAVPRSAAPARSG